MHNYAVIGPEIYPEMIVYTGCSQHWTTVPQFASQLLVIHVGSGDER